MPEPRRGYFVELCRQAQDLDYGILIETDNVESLRSSFYSKLKEEGLNVDDFDISLCTPSTPNTLYILKRSVQLP